MTKVEFQKACLEAGIQLNEEQMNQFEKYMQLYKKSLAVEKSAVENI